MVRLACGRCGAVLTLDWEWGSPEQRDLKAAAGSSPVPEGLLIPLAEDRVPIREGGRQVDHLYSPEGAVAANPSSLVPGALASSGIDNGCCGSDGMDGPNRACLCGQVVATQWSDCWTWAEIRFLPNAVAERN
jgi:hypothetical protein